MKGLISGTLETGQAQHLQNALDWTQGYFFLYILLYRAKFLKEICSG